MVVVKCRTVGQASDPGRTRGGDATPTPCDRSPSLGRRKALLLVLVGVCSVPWLVAAWLVWACTVGTPGGLPVFRAEVGRRTCTYRVATLRPGGWSSVYLGFLELRGPGSTWYVPVEEHGERRALGSYTEVLYCDRCDTVWLRRQSTSDAFVCARLGDGEYWGPLGHGRSMSGGIAAMLRRIARGGDDQCSVPQVCGDARAVPLARLWGDRL